MTASHIRYKQCSSTGCATVADPTQLCYRTVCRVTTDHVHGGGAQLGGQQLVLRLLVCQELTLTDNGYGQADFAKSTYVLLSEVMAAVTPLAWAVAVDWAWVR